MSRLRLLVMVSTVTAMCTGQQSESRSAVYAPHLCAVIVTLQDKYVQQLLQRCQEQQQS